MRFVDRLYRSAQYIYRFVKYLQYLTLPAFRLARGRAETASIVRFLLKVLVFRAMAVSYRLARQRFFQDDTPILLHGTHYYVGLTSNEIALFGEILQDRAYEELDDFVPGPGWTVLDVGANIGIFAVQQARRGAQVYAFEPNPDCYRRLTKTVARNGLEPLISTFDYALAATPGDGHMVLDHGFTPGGTIVPLEQGAADGAATIRLTTLDHVAPSLHLSTISLLKIDTEGAEVDILRGATQTLPTVERVVLEYHSRDLLAEASGLLRDHGFALVRQVDQDTHVGRGVLFARKGGT